MTDEKKETKESTPQEDAAPGQAAEDTAVEASSAGPPASEGPISAHPPREPRATGSTSDRTRKGEPASTGSQGRGAKRWVWLGVALVIAAAAVGLWAWLWTPEWVATPDGFVEIEQYGFVYKAVSPDGSVIAVRHRDNEQEGDLEFWSEVFEREMVEGKGYRLVEEQQVTSGDGVSGTHLQLEYAHEGDTPFHYGLTVFVTEESIVTVETATELERHDDYAGAFEKARGSVTVRAAEGFLASF